MRPVVTTAECAVEAFPQKGADVTGYGLIFRGRPEEAVSGSEVGSRPNTYFHKVQRQTGCRSLWCRLHEQDAFVEKGWVISRSFAPDGKEPERT